MADMYARQEIRNAAIATLVLSVNFIIIKLGDENN